MDLHSHLRLILLLCVGSITCDNRKERRLHPEVFQPFDYRCPCVPSESCPNLSSQELPPCLDTKTVRCCSAFDIPDSRIYLGVEPLTSAVTTMDSIGSSSSKAAQHLTVPIGSMNFTPNKLDKELEEEIKVGFNIYELNNRNMKAIKASNISNMNIDSKDKKTDKKHNENKPVLEVIPETNVSFAGPVISIEEMFSNNTKLDLMINFNINKLYNIDNNESAIIDISELNFATDFPKKQNNSTVNDESILTKDSSSYKNDTSGNKATLMNVPSIVSKYQIVYPNNSRMRDESRKRFIVYPINQNKDNIDHDSNNNIENKTIVDENIEAEHASKTETMNDENKPKEIMEDIDFENMSEEELENEEELEEYEEAKEYDEMPSSSKILEHILEYGEKVKQNISTDEEKAFSSELIIMEPLVDTTIREKLNLNNNKNSKIKDSEIIDIKETIETSKEEKIPENFEDLEMLPIPSASEIVEEIVMPDEPKENIEDVSKMQGRIPIRLPSRNLKLQIQGNNRPQVRQNQQKRDNPLLKNNNSNIKEIINNQKYGLKVELPRPAKNRNSNINPRLKQRVTHETTTSEAGIDLDTKLNLDEEISETKLHGTFAPPDNMETGFLPMVGPTGLSIVGPIPLGFLDRSKPSEFQTEDGVRISDLNLPSEKSPQIFFSVFQQNKSHAQKNFDNEDSTHPELPEREPKDFLSAPSNEGFNASLYETTEDGVYVVQLPPPLEREPDPFRTEHEIDYQDNEQTETKIIYEQFKTDPVHHHNVDIEQESKEDQITQFQLPKVNQISQQSPGRAEEKVHFHQQLPLINEQNFRNNFNEQDNYSKKEFQKDVPQSEPPKLPNQRFNNYVISTYLELPKTSLTNFRDTQNEFSVLQLDGENTDFQKMEYVQRMQENNINAAYKLRFIVPNLQLPLESDPVNFRLNNAGHQQIFPLTENDPEKEPLTFDSSLDNQQINSASLEQGFSKAQVISGDPSRKTISLTQQLPLLNTVNFLQRTNEPLSSEVSSKQSNRNEQNLPLQLLPPQNDQVNFILPQQLPQNNLLKFNKVTNIDPTAQNRFPLTQQLPQNNVLKFNEVANINPTAKNRFPLTQQLPQTEVINFASSQEELSNDNTSFKQKLPINKELQPIQNEQKTKKTNFQKSHDSISEIPPVFSLRLPQAPIPNQRNPLKIPFQQNTKIQSEVTHHDQTQFQHQKPNDELNSQSFTNVPLIRPNRLPVTQNQSPGMTQAVIKPGELSLQNFKQDLNLHDTENTKYDIALEKYRADLKIYQDQYDAFLRKKFPSVIRIF